MGSDSTPLDAVDELRPFRSLGGDGAAAEPLLGFP